MKLQFLEPGKEEDRKYFFGDVMNMTDEGFCVQTLNISSVFVPFRDVIALWEKETVYSLYHDSFERLESYEVHAFERFAAHKRNALRMKIRINPKKVVEIRN